MSIFSQMPVAADATIDQAEDKIKATAAFLKTIVFEQLGLPSTLGEDGVVREIDGEGTVEGTAPKAASSPSAAAPKKPSAPVKKQAGKLAAKALSPAAAEKAALWQQWVDDPSQWWDNRDNKTNPRSPDFKHKTTGKGLWIDEKTPAFARLLLDGDAELIEDDEVF